MKDLAEQIDNFYSNGYLLKLNDQWQVHVDAASQWEARPYFRQDEFFRRFLEVPFLEKDLKVCVIISDALRYEIGEELLSLIRQQDRYEAELEPMLTMLPSYTQMGMAALLPHRKLALAENETSAVLVDGQSSVGLVNRTKILHLAKMGGKRAAALKADEFMAMKGDDCRILIRENDVVYVYHNRIDAAGDKRESEDQVFEAVEKTLEDMIRLIKKMTGANASNLIITADHGFIYQDRPIEESDFSGSAACGDEIFFRDRRFVLGKGLKDAPGLHKFTSSLLKLDGDVEIQIPRSINRLRLRGSGSRFVHGGAALQEVVVPVLKVNKKRKSNISAVSVNILAGAGNIITSGQLAVGFYQENPVSDKVRPRNLRAGIYTLECELISDSHDLSFDIVSDNPRDRELKVRFLLTSKADQFNNQEVILKLLEKVSGTSHYKDYKSLRYILRRSFTSDFDF
ncbi:BREX-1 system phosphatase PglZ type A [Desulfonatronovibrio magnus]|uniref:BREX-1 system phosphatase PglZ type A n=1 Tax=Desulfonatronovibrio magnus TaxID=698827 RepID=UPI0006970593|nr:BREX-1 system phosphatase PglZ type A [Desulfonatronovibrio magnus]